MRVQPFIFSFQETHAMEAKCDKEQHGRQTRSLFISLSVLTMYSRTWLWKFCSLIVTSSSSILHIAETHSLATHFWGESIHCNRKRIYGIIRPPWGEELDRMTQTEIQSRLSAK